MAALVKYADNCFHATKITFANEVGMLCRELGVDAHAVMQAFASLQTPEAAARYLKPGFAFGGSCLPKDLRAVLDLARAEAAALPMLAGVAESNRIQLERMLERIIDDTRDPVGVIGLAFKEGTDDVRESPMVTVVEQLCAKGHPVHIFDERLSVSDLVGANRSFALQRIPHLADLLADTLETVVARASTVIIGHRLTPAAWRDLPWQAEQRIIDVVGGRGAAPPARLRGALLVSAKAGDTRPKTLLILTQVYLPDAAAAGQYMAEAASAMVERGWRVVVLTSGRGYEDPSIRHPARETIDGVDVRRIPLSSLGKRWLPLRILAAWLFLVQVIARGVLLRPMDCLLVGTSPPMCIVAALGIGLVRRVPIKFWAMDLNPDQLIALGKIGPRSAVARLMDVFNRRILRRASDVVTMDRFMAERLQRKLDVGDRLTISPPWPAEDSIEPVPHEANPFRAEHGLEGKLTFMYSGSHGISYPLATFLEAAARFRDDPDVAFVFVGQGVRKREVTETIEQHGLSNMLSLPYQPLDRLRYSLSAADVHIVSLADTMVGITHPSKIYGAMAAARPILLLGPEPSHVSEIIDESPSRCPS